MLPSASFSAGTVCERDRETERQIESVCFCVRERACETEREKARDRERKTERERQRERVRERGD